MIHFDLRKFHKFRKAIASGHGLKDVYTQWGKRYLTFTKRRFRKNAAGGGEWPPLKIMTFRRTMGGNLKTTKAGKKRSRSQQWDMKRKYLRARQRVKILIDTGTLFKAISPYMPGNLFQFLKKGIRVGFAGSRLHKNTDLTVKGIAMKHQKGDPSINLPQRKILHVPSSLLRASMMRDLRMGIQKLGRRL